MAEEYEGLSVTELEEKVAPLSDPRSHPVAHPSSKLSFCSSPQLKTTMSEPRSEKHCDHVRKIVGERLVRGEEHPYIIASAAVPAPQHPSNTTSSQLQLQEKEEGEERNR